MELFNLAHRVAVASDNLLSLLTFLWELAYDFGHDLTSYLLFLLLLQNNIERAHLRLIAVLLNFDFAASPRVRLART